MTKYCIVASDFDDTLLRSDLTVSDYTKAVIAEFTEEGGAFLITTGRTNGSARKSAARAGLTRGLVISYQGAMIEDLETGEEVLYRPLDWESAVWHLKKLEKGPGQVQIYHKDRLYVTRRDARTAEYERVCEVEAEEVGVPLSEFVEQNRLELCKILVIAAPEEAAAMLRDFSAERGGDFYYCLSKPIFFEVLAKGVSKGEAVRFVAERMGKSLENVLGFGDGINDLPLIEAAAVGFAVENAQPALKEAAGCVCPSNDEDGVARTMVAYCGLKEPELPGKE